MNNTDPNRCACGNRKPINVKECEDCAAQRSLGREPIRDPTDNETREPFEGAD